VPLVWSTFWSIQPAIDLGRASGDTRIRPVKREPMPILAFPKDECSTEIAFDRVDALLSAHARGKARRSLCEDQLMPFGYRLRSLQFSDGTRVALPTDSVLAIVGPNNSGKSVCLREIQQAAVSNPGGPQPARFVLHEVEIEPYPLGN
jgi:hypothetical protein